MGLSETIRERDRDRPVGMGLVVAVMVAVAAQVLVPNTVVQGAPWAVGFGAVLLRTSDSDDSSRPPSRR